VEASALLRIWRIFPVDLLRRHDKTSDKVGKGTSSCVFHTLRKREWVWCYRHAKYAFARGVGEPRDGETRLAF